MLSVFFGNDTITVRQKAHDAIVAQEKNGAVLERIDADTYAPGIFTDVAGATSLFGSKTIYLIDTPSNQTELFEAVIENLPVLKDSLNQFVVIEDALLAPEKKKFTKYAETIEEYKKPATERFNAFAMADSLLKKDKRMLWVQLQEAKHHGLSSEEIIGTMWWQLKCLRLANQASSPAEAGMKEFPFNKAKRSLNNFKSGEIESLSNTLLSVYHDGHSGRADIDHALEKWTLTI